ncbi:RNA polymerase II transcription factor SIII subunit A-domain-containing protein [Favolaschia claudopus]|uniref:RNA polymerase II transcription factor SIII subunit A-domain-containing protein n=1 Tax=Favolaschia claudopus TaxID=2862362 RepID=A0AAW0CHT2_9AGAR
MALPDDRVPTLVQYCQRVAAIHVEAISSFGDELRYDLVKPILQRCTVDQLLRLEQASPHLQKDTPEIWKELCFRTYPTAAERYHRGEIPEPESWKDQYFNLVEEEARRFEEVGLKIRRQRQEADERKKEQEIKITNQIPQGKRRWGVSAPPKTLFQKTKSEASKMQKNMYTKPLFPPMPSNGRNFRVLPADKAVLLPPHSGETSSRVTVNTVVHRVSAFGPVNSKSSSPMKSSPNSALSVTSLAPSPSPVLLSPRKPNTVSLTPSPSKSTSSSLSFTGPSSVITTLGQDAAQSPPKKRRLTSPEHSSPGSDPRPSRSLKRDPMASLFLPKHRAYSQRIS